MRHQDEQATNPLMAGGSLPQVAAASESPAIDELHLATVTGGDADLRDEVLQLFVAQARRLDPTLVPEAPEPQRSEALHLLKGSARAIGAGSLAATVEQLEAALGSGGIASAHWQALRTTIQTTCDHAARLGVRR